METYSITNEKMRGMWRMYWDEEDPSRRQHIKDMIVGITKTIDSYAAEVRRIERERDEDRARALRSIARFIK
jgi:hypothetical protein